MARYVVERTFPEGFNLPMNDAGAETCSLVVSNNAEEHVTWLHSYFTKDKTKSFCIYEAPNPEAIRQVARRNNLPVDHITEVSVLDPYFYK
ncbi:MAG: DUF4242 domain-containing protein [Ktedonobacterales bacterium]|nr:DUF4242 domain-containing protein [Ktedonobacterales bacterium]